MTATIAEALSMSQRLADYVTVLDNGCVVWTGALTNGYGQPGWHGKNGKRTNKLAHRVAYEAVHGPIPKGMHLDHICHDPNECQPETDTDCPHRACVNPDHLKVVTPRENTLRSNSPIAINARKTHCDNGHELNDENTYVYTARTYRTRMCRPVSGCGGSQIPRAA